MSLDEFKRQVQNQFAIALSWDEVRGLQKLCGNPETGTIDFLRFATALEKSPGHGPNKSRGWYNFLPQNSKEFDLKSLETRIVHKLEDRCQVAGNYQYQMARRMLCDACNPEGLDKDQFKLRISSLLGVELTEAETDALFTKYA
ncbi:unnamed protein product, partial [Discosporangium mesarthrocarpum]